VYERLGIPTVATVRWTADRMLRHLVPHGLLELWRDPTSTVSIVEVPLHPGWISKPLRALEEATGARAAFVMRFGVGMLPFLLEGVGGDRGLNQPDQIHPTAAGQKIIAETVWKRLQPLLLTK